MREEIKIDPLDFHVGLKDNMAEFESLIRMKSPGKKLAEQVENDLKSRFCHCCFFGHVEGELMGEPLCKDCAKILYGFDADEERPSIKKIDPYYQLWYRRQKALPIFEAYLHSEIERYKLKQNLEDAKATAYAESVDAGMENRRLKRALWLARAERYKMREFIAREEGNLCNQMSWSRFLRERTYSQWVDQLLRIANLAKKLQNKCRAKAEEYK